MPYRYRSPSYNHRTPARNLHFIKMDVPFQLAIDRQVLLPDRFLYRLGSGIDGPLLLIQGRIRSGHAVDQLGSVEPDIPFPLAEAGSPCLYLPTPYPDKPPARPP